MKFLPTETVAARDSKKGGASRRDDRLGIVPDATAARKEHEVLTLLGRSSSLSRDRSDRVDTSLNSV
jgi:hypothetical protein